MAFDFLVSRLGVIWVLRPKKQKKRVQNGHKTEARSGIGSGLFCVYGIMRGGILAAALKADRQRPRLLWLALHQKHERRYLAWLTQRSDQDLLIRSLHLRRMQFVDWR